MYATYIFFLITLNISIFFYFGSKLILKIYNDNFIIQTSITHNKFHKTQQQTCNKLTPPSHILFQKQNRKDLKVFAVTNGVSNAPNSCVFPSESVEGRNYSHTRIISPPTQLQGLVRQQCSPQLLSNAIHCKKQELTFHQDDRYDQSIQLHALQRIQLTTHSHSCVYLNN